MPEKEAVVFEQRGFDAGWTTSKLSWVIVIFLGVFLAHVGAMIVGRVWMKIEMEAARQEMDKSLREVQKSLQRLNP